MKLCRCLPFASGACALVAVAIFAVSPAATADEAIARAATATIYDNFAALQTRLERIAQADEATLTSLGKTLAGRDIWLLTLGGEHADKQEKNADKPGILIVGSVEAEQLVGGELTLQMAEALVAARSEERDAGEPPTPDDSKTATRAELAQLLDHFTLYIIPRPSPDASERVFDKLKIAGSLNQRATDDDRDGDTDEDAPDDLDGNSIITQMRVADPSGKWMTHPDDARVMIEADPKKNERGRWLVYSEGSDNDADGKWNEDGLGGVDFNRNFTFQYPYFTAGAGPHQVSEAETRAVADFAFDHPNILAVYSFSPQDNLVQPWKPNGDSDRARYKTSILSADATYADFVAAAFRRIFDPKDAPASDDDAGTFAAWAYFHYGRWSFSARPWWVPQVSREELARIRAQRAKANPDGTPAEENKSMPSDEKRGAMELNALRWLEAAALDGFVPWTPIEHPDFPGQDVEVGGFAPGVLLNPPRELLAGLAEKHLKFLTEIDRLRPRLTLAEVKCTPLGSGIYRVSVTVLNEGYLPTLSAMGQDSEHVSPAQVELSLPKGAQLLTNSARRRLPILAGQGGESKQNWVVAFPEGTKPELSVRAWSPSVGSISQEVAIPAAP